MMRRRLSTRTFRCDERNGRLLPVLDSILRSVFIQTCAVFGLARAMLPPSVRLVAMTLRHVVDSVHEAATAKNRWVSLAKLSALVVQTAVLCVMARFGYTHLVRPVMHLLLLTMNNCGAILLVCLSAAHGLSSPEIEKIPITAE